MTTILIQINRPKPNTIGKMVMKLWQYSSVGYHYKTEKGFQGSFGGFRHCLCITYGNCSCESNNTVQ